MTEIRSNGRGGYTVDYDIGDLAIMAEALSSAAATTLVYGKVAKPARKRLDELRQLFHAISPIPQGHREEAYEWFNACAAVRNAETYGIHVVKPKWASQDERDLVIRIDGKDDFKVANRVKLDEIDALTNRIEEGLLDAAGMDTILLERVPCRVPVSRESIWDDEAKTAAVAETLDAIMSGSSRLSPIRPTVEIREVEYDWDTKAADGRRVIYAVLGVPSFDTEAVTEAIKAELARPAAAPAAR